MNRKRYEMIVTMVLIWLAIGLLAAAQPETDLEKALEAIEFRPIEDILETDLIVSHFASDGTATLPIETRIPVACTLVYGTTPEFGKLTLDQDMAGGTHTTHNPLLTDLEPETTYYYRVQGVDDAGNIYVSQTMTFTTPPQEEATVENLLSPELGAQILGVSSNWNGQPNDGSFGILNAFDGSPNTAWSSNADGNDAWVEIQLAQRSRIQQVEFWTRSMSDGTAQIFEFTVTTDSGETYGPFTLPDPDQPYVFEVEFEAETLRFDVTDSSGGNVGAVEIAVYGEPIEG
jgi:hypothetical protein